jgi:hypothetical protein
MPQGAHMHRIAMIALLLGGCEQWDTVTAYLDDRGNVYECTLDDGREVEYCTNAGAAELAELLGGGTCSLSSRRWYLIGIVGCAVICDGQASRGCNATSGCHCP